MSSKLKNFAKGGGVGAEIARERAQGATILPTARPEMRQHDIPVADLVRNPEQPRKFFDQEDIISLAESIAERGQLQPIVVRPQGDGTFMVIAGERRWRAVEYLGRETIRAVWSLSADPAIDGLLENCQRRDLLPIEVAEALAALVEHTDMTGRAAARLMGYREDVASRLLKIASLPEQVREECATDATGREVSLNALYEVAMCESPIRQALLWDAAKEGASVAQLRELRTRAEADPAGKKGRKGDGASQEEVLQALHRTVTKTARAVAEAKTLPLTDDHRKALQTLRDELNEILQA